MKKTSNEIRFETRVPIRDVMNSKLTTIGIGAAKDLRPSKVHVNDIMSTPLITVSADKTAGDAARMMVKHTVRRLPVIDERHKVIGIVTVRDLLAVSNEQNDLLMDLIEINREETEEAGMCGRCSQMSDDLKRVDGVSLCPGCREEDNIT
jgi:CBS-domain-containing membrane protein